MLGTENEKLLRQLEQAEKRAGGPTTGGGQQIETAKKLKKRELECAALWETLKDMHVSGRNIFDVRQMMELLALRALDVKARRKLKLS